MAFVKEKRYLASPDWEDTSEVWELTSIQFSKAKYDVNFTNAWTIENKYNFNTFEYMGRNTDNDITITESENVWEALTDYHWFHHALNNKIQTLDGNWESKTQTSQEKIDLGSRLKFSWVGITDTWEELT